MRRFRPLLWAAFALVLGGLLGWYAPTGSWLAPGPRRVPGDGREPPAGSELMTRSGSASVATNAAPDASTDTDGLADARDEAGSPRADAPPEDRLARLEAALRKLEQGESSAPREDDDWVGLLRGLSQERNADAVPLVSRLLDRDLPLAARAEALRMLELVGTPEAVDVLVRLARESERDRSPALERLARIDARAAAPALARVLHEEPPGPLLVAATRALGRTRVRAYVLDISRLVRSPPAEAAVAPLDATRDAAIDSVMEDVLLAAVEALGLIADPDGIPALERALASPSARVRRTAVRALGKIRAPAAIRVLESFALSTEVERERSLAEDALARLAGEPGGPFSRADR